MRNRFMKSSPEIYRFTFHSNCNGGGVIIDGVEVGKISNGIFIYDTPNNYLGTVSISGGVPATKQELVDEVEHRDITGRYIESNSNTDNAVHPLINGVSNRDVYISVIMYLLNISIRLYEVGSKYYTREYLTTTYQSPSTRYGLRPGSYTFNYTSSTKTSYVNSGKTSINNTVNSAFRFSKGNKVGANITRIRGYESPSNTEVMGVITSSSYNPYTLYDDLVAKPSFIAEFQVSSPLDHHFMVEYNWYMINPSDNETYTLNKLIGSGVGG